MTYKQLSVQDAFKTAVTDVLINMYDNLYFSFWTPIDT